MAELRAYYYNGGDMLELVRYQKKDFQETAGLAKDILSSSQILQSEKTVMGNWENIWKAFHTVFRYKAKKSYILLHISGDYKNIFQL